MQTFDLKSNVAYYGMGFLVFGYRCILDHYKKNGRKIER
jgi:hypothetical protein